MTSLIFPLLILGPIENDMKVLGYQKPIISCIFFYHSIMQCFVSIVLTSSGIMNKSTHIVLIYYHYYTLLVKILRFKMPDDVRIMLTKHCISER